MGGGWRCDTLELKIFIVIHARRGSCDYAEPLCQSLSGSVVDDRVACEVLKAVEPAAPGSEPGGDCRGGARAGRVIAALAARRERARQEVERAARQYHACEPENRLVARELERRWEESLRSQRQLEEEYERWQRTAIGRLSADDERSIRALASDLPAVWYAATTTPADRQRIARLLLERVAVTVDKASERVDLELHWVGGLMQSHTLARPVKRYDLQSDYPRLVERLRARCRAAQPPRRSPSGSTRRASDRRNGWTGSRARWFSA